MWYARLKNLGLWHKLIFGLGAATSLFVAAWFVGASGVSWPLHPVRPPAASANRQAIANAAVNAAAGKSAPATPTQAPSQLTPAHADLIDAKFAVLRSPAMANDDSIEPTPPPAAPVVAGVEAPAASIAPAPQPMEVAMQTAEAPAAPVAAARTQPAKVSYFGEGSSSVQHLPMPTQ